MGVLTSVEHYQVPRIFRIEWNANGGIPKSVVLWGMLLRQPCMDA